MQQQIGDDVHYNDREEVVTDQNQKHRRYHKDGSEKKSRKAPHSAHHHRKHKHGNNQMPVNADMPMGGN